MAYNSESLGKRWESYQLTKTQSVMACAACVVATIVVGFTWGGWTTGATARTMVGTATTGARNELAAAMCLDRFQASANASTELVALKALSTWDRAKFIEQGGWAAMPTGAEPAEQAAKLCAERAVALPAPTATATP